MVTRSVVDYEQHCADLMEYYTAKCRGDKSKAKQFIDFYRSRYDKFNRAFLYHKFAWSLYDDYRQVEKTGIRWYAIVGDGGTGKTTLAKNVGYFLDDTFSSSRVKMAASEIVELLSDFSPVNAMKSVLLDEPDFLHPSSKLGVKFRSILGKARQQKLFMLYCATDMRDIPAYIYNKISGVIFCKFPGEAKFFKNYPRKGIYTINTIKRKYYEIGYGAFGVVKAFGLDVKPCPETPLSSEDEMSYLKQKQDDYTKDIQSFLSLSKKVEDGQPKNEREELIVKRKQEGKNNVQIAEELGVSKVRIGQILRNLAIGKG